MLSRYSPTRTEQRKLMKHLLWKSQGGCCKICGRKTALDEGVIEHHDRNPANYSPENIGFVCYSCNQRKRPDYCQKGSMSNGKVERENARGCSSETDGISETETERNRKRARLKKSPLEIQINQEGEPKFRRYLWENVGREGGLIKEDAIAEGAAIAGVNVQTTARWLAPAVSLVGPFRIFTVPGTETEIIKLRDNYSPPDTAMGRIDFQMMQERSAQADAYDAELKSIKANLQAAGISLDKIKDLPVCVMCSRPFVPFPGSNRTCAPCLLKGSGKGEK